MSMKGGKTFFWKGKYQPNMNDRETLEVQLNVFGNFRPKLPDAFRRSDFIFLANGSPLTQMSVLEQVPGPKLVVADTMDLWIREQNEPLMALFRRIDGLVLNDSEAKLLTGDENLVAAGRKVLGLGPQFVVIKKGEHGAMFFSAHETYVLPAFPTERVVDPTGAGDSFAGGMMGYLASQGNFEPKTLKEAMAYGILVASFNVEDFSLGRLHADRAERPRLADGAVQEDAELLDMPRLRTFIAVELSSQVKARAAALIGKLRGAAAQVNWVQAEQMHLTLKFLGDVPDIDTPDICRVVAASVKQFEPFEVVCRGVGAFPKTDNPRTIWIGIQDGADELCQLQAAVDDALKKELGFAREPRKFQPHLTIGRVKHEPPEARGELAELLAQHADYDADLAAVDEVVVFASFLSRGGPEHEALGTAVLGG